MSGLVKVTPHIAVDTTLHTVDRSANVGGISLEQFSIAIDSGQRYDTAKTFRRQLETFFDLPVKYLFLTHTHTDHRKGLMAFKDVTIITSQKAVKNMPKNVKLNNFTVETFDEKTEIKENDLKVEFHLVGGHTIGSSIAYFPHEKVLFGGDLFFSSGANFNIPFLNFYQNASYDPRIGKKTGNPDEYIIAFEKFQLMDIEVLIPGHGGVVFNPKEELNTLITFFKALRTLFISAIEEKKGLKDIKFPNLELIKQAFNQIESLSENRQRQDKRWLDNYLEKLKFCFYNHYKSQSNI